MSKVKKKPEKPIQVPQGAHIHLLDREYRRAVIKGGLITWPKGKPTKEKTDE